MTENHSDPSPTDACDRDFASLDYPVDGREIGDSWYHRQGWEHATAVAAAEIAALTQELARYREASLAELPKKTPTP